MTYILDRNWLVDVGKGLIPGHSILHKFGYGSVGTSLTPVTSSLTYQTPTSAAALEILSSDANDTAAGTGARTVYVEGLDASGDILTETVTMNGTAAVALANSFLRVFTMYVATSGTYASVSAPSNVGTITLRGSGGGSTWAVINVDGAFGLGRSLISPYTVPNGYTAHVLSYNAVVEATKTVDLFVFKREGILTTSAPYTTMQLLDRYKATGGSISIEPINVVYVLPQLTDFGYLAKVATGSAGVTVNSNILLIQN